MSKVLVLGGAGLQGAAAAKMLSGLDGIECVVVADLDPAAAERVARGIGDQARADCVDAHDPADVRRVIDKWQPRVVLNCVGPYRRFGAATLKVAIEARVDYLDLLDDAEPLDAYFALDQAARDAGVTAVHGVGFTPGLTNIMGRYLAQDLDSVDEIHWTYLMNGTPYVPSHLWTHRVQMYADNAQIVRNGEVVSVPGGSLPVNIEWRGFGTFPAAVCTHPEPVCAQRFYGNLKHSSIRGCYTAPEFLSLLTVLGNSGWGEARTFTSQGAELRADVLIGDFLNSPIFRESVLCRNVLDAEAKYGAVDGVRVAVSGRRGRAVVRRAMQTTHPERWFCTHTTAAVCAGILATGKLHAPGVHSAEVFEPGPTLQALAAVGISIEEVSAQSAPEFVES
jgi:saccharopine dehydrogenase-like NADP-dependent oxidoreductase